jgi:hypothetical protein
MSASTMVPTLSRYCCAMRGLLTRQRPSAPWRIFAKRS